MRRSPRRATSSPRAILGFWALVFAAALLLGGAAFATGRYLIGNLIQTGEVDTGAPEIVVRSPDSDGKNNNGESPAPPPAKAVIELEEREPTDAEKRELELSLPQDGADVNREARRAEPPDTSVGPDDKPLAAERDKADAPAEKSTAKKTATGKAKAYTVVSGSFGDATNAEREVARLTAEGYKPYVVKVEKDGKTFHRVCAGSFADQDEAAKLRDKLRKDGSPAALTHD